MAQRVLVIAPTPFFSNRGTPIRILEEVRALRHRGIECVIATYPIGDTPQSLAQDSGVRIERVTNVAPWYTKRSAGASFTKVAFDLALALRVRSLIAQESFDVIHAHNHEGIVIAWLAKQLSRVFPPVVADLHGSLSEEVSPKLAGIEKLLEKIPAAVVTSSQQNTERVQNVRAAHSVTTLNDAGLDAELFTSLELTQDAKALRSAHAIPEHAFVVTYAGGYGKEKGTDTLISVFSKLIQADSRIHCVLVGNVPIHIEMAIRENIHPEQHAQFHSIASVPYEQLPILLSATDCAIDPKPESSNQASGKILNAIAAGIPIVAYDREYNRQLISHNQLVQPQDGAHGFVDAILRFAHDSTLYEQTRTENTHKAAQYTWATVAEKLLAVYTTVQ